MEKTKLWYCISNNGDGSASVLWFLTKERAEKYDNEQMESGDGFAEDSVGYAETFIGSDIHKEAIEMQKDMEDDERMDRDEQGRDEA